MLNQLQRAEGTYRGNTGERNVGKALGVGVERWGWVGWGVAEETDAGGEILPRVRGVPSEQRLDFSGRLQRDTV